MRRTIGAVALLLAACQQRSAPATNAVAEANAPANSPASVNAPEANEAEKGTNAAANSTLGKLPPPNAGLRFVGRWAASQAECASKAWVFTRDRLSAAEGPNCTFYKVTSAPGGYDIAATCPAKKPVETDLIRLRFAESARAMLVESNAIAPMGLVYCGK
jgi:hypothetical protein